MAKWNLEVGTKVEQGEPTWAKIGSFGTKKEAQAAAKHVPLDHFVRISKVGPIPEPAMTGIVERVNQEERYPFAKVYYGPVCERKEFYLDVALRLEDGRVAYFKTPAFTRTVAAVPGAAIVTFHGTGEAPAWQKEVGDVKVATPGVSNDNKLVPLVQVGDQITVTGRVAEKTSRAGRPYLVLTHIRRLG